MPFKSILDPDVKFDSFENRLSDCFVFRYFGGFIEIVKDLILKVV